MITKNDKRITKNEIQQDVSKAEDHAMALSLILKYARMHSKESMFKNEIQDDACDYKIKTELLFGFIEDSLKDLSEKMNHSYQRLDDSDMV